MRKRAGSSWAMQARQIKLWLSQDNELAFRFILKSVSVYYLVLSPRDLQSSVRQGIVPNNNLMFSELFFDRRLVNLSLRVSCKPGIACFCLGTPRVDYQGGE